MKKRLWFLISIPIAASLLFVLAGCASEGDTGYTGTVSYSWYTPDHTIEQDGYYEGSQTITMENGIVTKAEAEMVIFELSDPSFYWGISLITVMQSPKSGSTKGIFRDVTSAKFYGLISQIWFYGDPVPKAPINIDSLWVESSFVWSDDDLAEMTAMSGATVLAKYSFDNEGGRRKAMRIFSTSSGNWDKAQQYPTWDETFDMPTEIWHWAYEGDIPAGYDYVTNELELVRYYDGVFDHKYEITLDGQGRISTLVDYTGQYPEYGPYALQVFTYDGDSQDISGVTRYEVYHGDIEPGVYTNPDNYSYNTLSMTFDMPAESGFKMEEMLLLPMQRLFLPFIYQDEFLPT